MADNIEHQDKGELVANCDRFNSLKHSTVRSYTYTRRIGRKNQQRVIHYYNTYSRTFSFVDCFSYF